MKEFGAQLAAGGLVAVRDAFEPAFAEQMYESLDNCTAWQVYEEYEKHFHFHHRNLYEMRAFPPALKWCDKVFDSEAATKAWAARLSGRQCEGRTQFSASLYLPGDHSLPHNDVVDDTDAKRQVAFVWHLAKNWPSEWGGAIWCPKNLYLPPVFNTLLLFNVGPDTNHFVTQVSPYAQSKRLTINGWWTGPAPTGKGVRPTPYRIDAEGVRIEIY
jgi:Rps23 Pro-64 3,4-dihydroxylase Tpa1-like proline 4-hydroxylase